MKTKTIKKSLGHSQLIDQGFKFIKVQKGFFKDSNLSTIQTPVLVYRKERYSNADHVSIHIGHYTKYCSRFETYTNKY